MELNVWFCKGKLNHGDHKGHGEKGFNHRGHKGHGEKILDSVKFKLNDNELLMIPRINIPL